MNYFSSSQVIRRDFPYLIRFRQSHNMTLFIPRGDALVSRRLSRKILSRHVVSGDLL